MVNYTVPIYRVTFAPTSTPQLWLQTMTQLTFAAKLDEMLGLLERAMTAIEQGGGPAELRHLQKLLGELLNSCLRLVERNPGIDAAASDVYAAASAIVSDSGVEAQPYLRKQRLFREARQRLRDRLAGARPSTYATQVVWRHHELLLSA